VLLDRVPGWSQLLANVILYTAALAPVAAAGARAGSGTKQVA
jgi:hypothetical protein